MVSVKDFDNDFEKKWCPGCGNFSILSAMKQALAALDLSPDKIVIFSGIGQAAKTPHFITCNFFHGLHGRALPAATGAKIANHDLTILVSSGDGDCYGEGGSHFMNAVRRNIDITLLVHDNKIYGLTKGQASPTTDVHTMTKAQPFGVISEPFNPLAVALVLKAGFVARGFAGNTGHLSNLIQAGVQHRGFSIIDILQPCVSFNHVNTYQWYTERVYELEKEGYAPDNLHNALDKAREWGDRIPIGILYKEEKPSFTDHIPALGQGPLVNRAYERKNLVDLLNRF